MSASASAEPLPSATAEMEDDAEFWKSLAYHGGPFAFVSASGSAHILKWAPPPRKSTKNGVIGFYLHLSSFPLEQSLAHTGGCRIHASRESPCSAMHHPSKYGQLPPLVAHGRILQLLSDTSADQWPELAKRLAFAAAEKSTLHAAMELPAPPSPDPPTIVPPLPPPAENHPELPPSEEPPRVENNDDVSIRDSGTVRLILSRAEEVRKPRRDSGLFDFVV